MFVRDSPYTVLRNFSLTRLNLRISALFLTLCRDIAANRRELAHLRITHILNASHSKWRGGAEYYEGTGIRYLGIEAHDSPSFDMSPYFYPAADFIHQALNEGQWERFLGVGSWDGKELSQADGKLH